MLVLVLFLESNIGTTMETDSDSSSGEDTSDDNDGGDGVQTTSSLPQVPPPLLQSASTAVFAPVVKAKHDKDQRRRILDLQEKVLNKQLHVYTLQEKYWIKKVTKVVCIYYTFKLI